MYWTDWGDLPKIERATMAGQHRSIIVQYNLTWPNALAMDYDTETLYWTDAATKTIELINLATMRRKASGPLVHSNLHNRRRNLDFS